MLNAKSFVIGIKIEDHSPVALLVFYIFYNHLCYIKFRGGFGNLEVIDV
jgi:hypothetical protein